MVVACASPTSKTQTVNTEQLTRHGNREPFGRLTAIISVDRHWVSVSTREERRGSFQQITLLPEPLDSPAQLSEFLALSGR